ncbi:heterodisulfide reductase subunit B [Desulfobaculum xiamenense]|uniref:Heterodisulfide reductase subunit B n=1 Tax=Desulfobaculum xiamenense TaxID=995050 RepID=A0A846QG58_9BACT|nr:CoB--CoM heterodisulfide reductase iron-sulfur subunit B family protein [Desulfobaculum xiamenense]NJB67288.1 heterodisulfide reductase subunit B [Desulfobaculum xiamenense]
MKYAYYPGCSLSESAKEFDVSFRAVMERLGLAFEEIPDWTCCGASAAESVDAVMNHALPARNLALVERDMGGVDVVAPCSACYLNLLKVNREVVGNRPLSARVNEALGAAGLSYGGQVRVRHLLDVLLNDVGAQAIAERVTNPLEGMPVAAYYGCQILRPYPVFDDPNRPTSMEPVLGALGATVHEWDMGGRCCGASLMATHRDVAIESVAAILAAAAGAEAIVTVCPLCQMNLEAYQAQAVRRGGREVPILYLTQLMGLAFGMGQEAMMLQGNLSVTGHFRSRLETKPWRSKDAAGDSVEDSAAAEQ